MKRQILTLLILIMCALSLFGAGDPFSYPLETVIIDAGHGGHDPGATMLGALPAVPSMRRILAWILPSGCMPCSQSPTLTCSLL